MLIITRGGGDFATGHLHRQLYLLRELETGLGERDLSPQAVILANPHPVCYRFFTGAFSTSLPCSIHFADTPQKLLDSTGRSRFDLVITDLLELDPPLMDMLSDLPSLPKVIFDDPRPLPFPALRINSLVIPPEIPSGESSRWKVGNRYLVLNPVLREIEPPPAQERRGVVATFGGSDPHHLSEALLELARKEEESFAPLLPLTLVVGSGKVLEGLQPPPLVDLLISPPDFHRRLAGASLAITTGGITAFEAACLGTPLVGTARSGHELANLRRLSGAAIVIDATCRLDRPVEVLRETLLAALELLHEPARLAQMGSWGRSQVDPLGARRVWQEILSWMKEGG